MFSKTETPRSSTSLLTPVPDRPKIVVVLPVQAVHLAYRHSAWVLHVAVLLLIVGTTCIILQRSPDGPSREMSAHRPWSLPPSTDLLAFLTENTEARLLAGFDRKSSEESNAAFLLTREQRMKLLGYDYAQLRGSRWPSRQAIEAHGLGWMRHAVGVSCLFFIVSFLVYLRMEAVAKPSKYVAHRLACMIAYFHAFQTVLAFCGDYLFSEDDSLDGIYSKYCNAIDNCGAYLGFMIQIPTAACLIIQVSYGRGAPIQVPVIIAAISITMGVLCKTVGMCYHRQMYWETCPQSWTCAPLDCIPGGGRWTAADYRNCLDFRLSDRRKLQRMHIFYMHFYHILWHILPAGNGAAGLLAARRSLRR